MADTLHGKRIACVATDGFEYAELMEPKKALEDEGAAVDVIAPHGGEIEGESGGKPAGAVEVDKTLGEAEAGEYDALLLPGGVRNPDTLRLSDEAIAFIRAFVEAEKPIAAICHGPWTLINAGGVRGKHVTSWPSLKLDLENAGAAWEDKEVIRDGILITSRNPKDIPAFNREMIATLTGAGS